MLTKKEIRNIILFVIAVIAVSAAVYWLIIEFAPYILGVIALPAWLAAALKTGANV